MNKIDIIVSEEQVEGTRFILRTWLKSPGSAVLVDEPIAEIETDKVTMEVSAPSSGVLGDNLTQAGTEVEPGMIIGSIASGDSANVANESRQAESPVSPEPPHTASSKNHDSEFRHSPSVQRLLEEHNCDPALITGTGRGGRITRSDVIAYVENLSRNSGQEKPQIADSSLSIGQKIPHNSMRLAIAEHMQRSVSIAPHVTALFEVDFTKIMRDREFIKDEFQRQNTKLTYTAYFIAACVKAINAVPAVNSRWHDDGLEVFSDINIGVGTALGDKGLVVPVVHGAQNLSLQEIAERLTDITGRARSSKLRPKDIQGGTFTISNHGVSGSLFAAPIIINQPQSAILGIGKVEKRAVVREVDGRDSIVICPMAYVSLTLDHRVLDAHQANSFLTKWVEAIEGWS